MSTISAAVSRITDCQECYWINQSLLPSGGLRSVRASVACAWFFGTKQGGGASDGVRYSRAPGLPWLPQHSEHHAYTALAPGRFKGFFRD